MHINGPKGCPSCVEKLAGGHAQILVWYAKIRAKFPDYHVSWVWRGQVDQDRFFRLGQSAVQWPNSNHNVMVDGKPRARAMDGFKLENNGQATFDRRYYLAIWTYLLTLGAPLRSGLDFKHPDAPHLELLKSVL